MSAQTTIHAGVGVTRARIHRLVRSGRVLVLADRRGGGRALLSDLPQESLWHETSEHLDEHSLTRAVSRARSYAPDHIIAIGGGTTIDTAKLVRLLACGGTDPAAVLSAARTRAVVRVAGHARPRVPMIAVPTTAGTASEVSAVAILTTTHGHRLVLGSSLRPDQAILDGANLLTLPHKRVAEGRLEALLRVIGAATSAQTSRRARLACTGLARSLLIDEPRNTPRAESLLRLSRLSAATHRPDVLGDADPFALKHWYIANEVSFVTRARKIPATAAIVPAVWARICAGDDRFGDQSMLREIWRSVAAAAGLGSDPVDGIREVLRRWAIPGIPRPTPSSMAEISTRVVTAWGGRLPTLRGVTHADIERVLETADWSENQPGTTATRSDREGVRNV